MQGFDFQFPAVRGVQAGREFYIAMCPLGVIPKVFAADESSQRAHERGQRVLNKSRVPKIAQFLLENPRDYAFSAITACIDGSASFEPIGEERDWELGRLSVPMAANLRITDGQHRWRAICEVLRQEPGLANETIPVVLYLDEGLERRQQIFADLNMHGIRPTRSLGILYDHRDSLPPWPESSLTKCLCSQAGQRSKRRRSRTGPRTCSRSPPSIRRLWRSSASRKVIRRGVADFQVALRFWQVLGEVIPEWSAVIADEAKPWELRAQYVHVHGVVLQALGAAGTPVVVAST